MVTVIRPELCVRCKGRLWCGLSKCPLLEARRLASLVRPKEEMEGYSPPSLLVGWRGYPHVNVTPLITLDNPRAADNPSEWAAADYTVDDILRIRMRTGGGARRADVREPGALEETVRELSMSTSPVATDLVFSSRPRITIRFGSYVPPIGFSGQLKRIELAENPPVDRNAEKFYYDEAPAAEAIVTLYEKGYDVYPLVRYLSAGIFGKRKRLVPTRWAITAVDNILSDHLLSAVSEYPPVDDVLLFYSNLFDNHFYIFFVPGPWAFELVEAWAAGSFWSSGRRIILSDGEVGRRRKKYADNVGGSYYAARLAVLEKLYEMRRRASVLVLREVREGYYAPLGVWQVRENVRNALEKEPLRFSSLREAVEYAYTHLGMRIRPEEWREKSELMKGIQGTIV